MVLLLLCWEWRELSFEGGDCLREIQSKLESSKRSHVSFQVISVWEHAVLGLTELETLVNEMVCFT